MRIIRHVAIVALAIFCILGIPAYASGIFGNIVNGADGVSSASTIIDRPSGAYVVLINRERHSDEESLRVWEQFFQGREIDFIFEDISCVVADTDNAGVEMARSFMSRLPENQMSVRKENAVLMASKIIHGKYDVAVLSREAYEMLFSAGDLSPADAVIIEGDKL